MEKGPKGTYTYVVNPDNTVAIRQIKVAQISEGQALINSGLKANEQVVVDGQYKLEPGVRVTILHGQAAEEKPHKTHYRRRSHEPFRTFHPTAYRDRPADGGVVGRRPGRLSAVVGILASGHQLPDAYGHGAAAGH